MEGFGELGHVRDGAVDAVRGERMVDSRCPEAYGFRPDVKVPYSRPGQEKTLLGCEAIDGQTRRPRGGPLKGPPCQRRASEVGESLAHDEPAVFVNLSVEGVAVELSHNALRALSKPRKIVRGKPVTQVARGVEARTAIVECVGELVSYQRTKGAKFHSGVTIRVPEWRLQDGTGHIDLIGGGTI